MSAVRKQPWFPPATDVPLHEVRATPVGAYSITRWADAEPLLEALRSLLPSMGVSLDNARIVDGTANNGGDTIAFGLAAEKGGAVVAVESDPKEYAQLCDNLNVYQQHGHLRAVFPVCDDILTVWPSMAHGTDLLLMDPPWGGPEYKRQPVIRALYLNTANGPVDVIDAICDVFTKSPHESPKVVVLKVPKQYDEAQVERIGAAMRVFVLEAPKIKWIVMSIRT